MKKEAKNITKRTIIAKALIIFLLQKFSFKLITNKMKFKVKSRGSIVGIKLRFTKVW